MSLRVAIDIGGGFVDLVAVDEETGQMSWSKRKTTPQDFSKCVREVLDLSGTDPTKIGQLLHGQTLVINSILQRKGAKVGLITTQGFRDILALGRSNRRDIFNLRYRKQEPFVPRSLRLEVRERTRADGDVLQEIDSEQFVEVYESLLREGVGAVAISFINSYSNPQNERRALALMKAFHEQHPAQQHPHTCISSDLTREWREYERTSTCVLNAFVMPPMEKYLSGLTEKFRHMGVPGTLYVMLSSGGVASFEYASERPIETVESGPVAGIVGAVALGELIGERNIIALDGGSTTTKASLIENLTIQTGDYAVEKDEYRSGYPIKTPVVDISEIGNGGGSIAWLDEAGSLKVGPRNAGAEPGPACYGLGGTEPTLTDAYLVAGFLSPDYFLGGAMQIQPALAERAIEKIARVFDMSVEEAAFAIIRIANDNTAQLLRLISVQRGFDPRDFALIAYGGSGPMVSPFIAEELEIPRIIIPVIPPGNFSAWGLLMSDLKHTAAQTLVRRLDSAGITDHLNRAFAELEAEVRDMFRRENIVTDIDIGKTADLRYYGQEHTLTLPVAASTLSSDDTKNLGEMFGQLHEREYSFRLSSVLEVVNVRVNAVVRVQKPNPLRRNGARKPSAEASTGTREVYWGDKGRIATSVYRRDLLDGDACLVGPAIVEDPTTTILVPPSSTARVDSLGNLILERR